jgi:hypothetical protein
MYTHPIGHERPRRRTLIGLWDYQGRRRLGAVMRRSSRRCGSRSSCRRRPPSPEWAATGADGAGGRHDPRRRWKGPVGRASVRTGCSSSAARAERRFNLRPNPIRCLPRRQGRNSESAVRGSARADTASAGERYETKRYETNDQRVGRGESARRHGNHGAGVEPSRSAGRPQRALRRQHRHLCLGCRTPRTTSCI